MEPQISGRKADSVIASLGFPNSHRVEAIGFSGGIWLAWYDSISVEILVNHFQFIHCRVTVKLTSLSVYATTIYTSPSPTGRKLLWPQLRPLAANIRSPWVLFGDFNATLSIDDRNGCIQASSKAFQHLLLDFGLRDMGYQGPDFTWTRGIAQARLNRFICNSYWDETYPISIVSHLLCIRSDHKPILLQVGNSCAHHSPSQFRYFSGWLSHEDFHRMVADICQPKATMIETLTNFTTAVDTSKSFMFSKTVVSLLLFGNAKFRHLFRLGFMRQACRFGSSIVCPLG
ncbi:hypothetical protein V6N13_024036 [Hibiscus sabdariffa]